MAVLTWSEWLLLMVACWLLSGPVQVIVLEPIMEWLGRHKR